MALYPWAPTRRWKSRLRRMRMSSLPWSASPSPSSWMWSPREAIARSTAAWNDSGGSVAIGIASRAIQSSSVLYLAVVRGMSECHLAEDLMDRLTATPSPDPIWCTDGSTNRFGAIVPSAQLLTATVQGLLSPVHPV